MMKGNQRSVGEEAKKRHGKSGWKKWMGWNDDDRICTKLIRDGLAGSYGRGRAVSFFSSEAMMHGARRKDAWEENGGSVYRGQREQHEHREVWETNMATSRRVQINIDKS